MQSTKQKTEEVTFYKYTIKIIDYDMCHNKQTNNNQAKYKFDYLIFPLYRHNVLQFFFCFLFFFDIKKFIHPSTHATLQSS